MGAYPLISKARYHARSISLPTRLHPQTLQYSEHLDRLNAAPSASSLSSSSPSDKLASLEDLYESAQALLLLPLNQLKLSRETHSRLADHALERSLALLDVVEATKEALIQTKENAQVLQSFLRRRRCIQGVAETDHLGNYFTARKQIKKVFQKFNNRLKGTERRFGTSDDERSSASVLRILKGTEAATISALELLVAYIYGIKVHSRPRGWSFASKVLQPKSEIFEAATLDCEEFKMVAPGKSWKASSVELQNLLLNLEELESATQDNEEKLDRLIRNLIGMRVLILNAFNQM